MTMGGSCLPSRLRYTPYMKKRPGTYDVKGQKDYDRIKNGEEKRYGAIEPWPCHDCGVAHGGYHHPGCDVEECPRCGRQLISCNCHEAGAFHDLIPQPVQQQNSESIH